MLVQPGIPLTQFISCPICLKVFNEKEYRPISLACGHTVCKSCILNKYGEKKCPFDKSPFPVNVDNLPANYALMQVIGAAIPEQDKESSSSSSDKPKPYLLAHQCIEEMAVHLKPLAENSSDDESKSTAAPLASSVMSEKSLSKCVLSRPIQRKLISLVHCQLLEEEGRSRSARIARSVGERIVTELLSLQQYPQQLSANLWAAVRTRGCQFLGPAMQEEVLKLILLALEDGLFLSRKVLVLFVVQRLETRYPQASKTAIGHVVQLLYRASCFKVMKRDEASSWMQLKDEFRQYDILRKEHDAQIVQIALEAGLRIPPEHWSSLLYGDATHKSHMQSIIDKHQSSQSFAQCIAELRLNLQHNGDPCNLLKIQPQLEFLSGIDPSPDCPAPSWENLEAIMRSLNTVMKSFVGFLSGPDYRLRLETMAVPNSRFKTSMCRDFLAKGMCPRGGSCTFAHSQDELERHRIRSRRSAKKNEGGENGESFPTEFFSQLSLSSSPPQSPTLSHSDVPSSMLGESMPSGCHVSSTPTTAACTSVKSTPVSATYSSSQYMGHPPVTASLHSHGQPSSKFLPASFMPTTRLTFSEPGKEVSEMPFYPSLGPQTTLHPHNLPYVGYCAHPPHPPHCHQQWLDRSKGMQTPGQPSYTHMMKVPPPHPHALPLASSSGDAPPPPPAEQQPHHPLPYGPRRDDASSACCMAGQQLVYPYKDYQAPVMVAVDGSTLQTFTEAGRMVAGNAMQSATPTVLVDVASSLQNPLVLPPGIVFEGASPPGYCFQPCYIGPPGQV